MSENEEIKNSDEGFDLDDILDSVKMAEHKEMIYLDPTIGERALEIKAAIERAANEPTPRDTGITDTNPRDDLEAALKELDGASMTFTFRALSSAEITACRLKVVATNKIPKNTPDDERSVLEEKRVDALYELLLSRSIIKAVYNKTGGERDHFTPEQVSSIRHKIVNTEWEKMKSAYNTAQMKAEAVETLMSDPSFRGADADEEE